MKMSNTVALMLASALLVSFGAVAGEGSEAKGWISLFDGKTLEGWKASGEKPESFSVKDGVIAAEGGRSHLFYVGPVANHNFKNFELNVSVMTTPGSNSGIYFHSEWKANGWPEKGYEAQINNTHSDWRKTGSLYGIDDNRNSPVKDNEWFRYRMIVKDKRITLKINGETIIDYTEPDTPESGEKRPGRALSSGTIAFQAHDPKSKTYFKNIWIRPLED